MAVAEAAVVAEVAAATPEAAEARAGAGVRGAGEIDVEKYTPTFRRNDSKREKLRAAGRFSRN